MGKLQQFSNKQLFNVKPSPFLFLLDTCNTLPPVFSLIFVPIIWYVLKWLYIKVLKVYIVFYILSNSILRAQSPKCWETWEIFNHLSNESPHHLANIPIKQSQKLPGWNEHYLQFMLWHNRLIFPRYMPNQSKKVKQQIRNSWLLLFCSAGWSVPLTLERILFLDCSFTRHQVHHPLNFLWELLTWDWNGCPQELG